MITRGLLPSSATIKDLSHEFGLPISQEELMDRERVATPTLPKPRLQDFQGRKPNLNSEVLAHQEKYLQWRNTVLLKVKGQEHSLVQVGVLSSLGPGVPAPPRLSHHLLGVGWVWSGTSPFLPWTPRRAGRAEHARSSPSQPWHALSYLEGEKECSWEYYSYPGP